MQRNALLLDEIRRTSDPSTRSLILAAAVNVAISARSESVYYRILHPDASGDLVNFCGELLDDAGVPSTHRQALSRMFEILVEHGQGAKSLTAVRDKLSEDDKKDLDEIEKLLLLFDGEEDDVQEESETSSSMDEDGGEGEGEGEDGFVEKDDIGAKTSAELISIQTYVGDLAEFCGELERCKQDLHKVPMLQNNPELTAAIERIDGSTSNTRPAIEHLQAAYESAEACKTHVQSAVRCFDAIRREVASRDDLVAEIDKLHAAIRLANGEYDPTVPLLSEASALRAD